MRPLRTALIIAASFIVAFNVRAIADYIYTDSNGPHTVDGTDNNGTLGSNNFSDGTAVNLGTGSIGGGPTADGRFAEVGIWTGAFNAAQRSSMCQNQQAYWNTVSCPSNVSMTINVPGCRS